MSTTRSGVAVRSDGVPGNAPVTGRGRARARPAAGVGAREERTTSVPATELGPDHRRLFAQIPSAYLVMDVDLVIVDANEAYLRLLGRRREDLVGRWVFDAFPPTADALDEDGRNPLQVSFETVRDTGRTDVLPLYQYGVVDPASGEVVERHWSLISAAVRGSDGRVALVVQRVEDVTDYVREHEGQRTQLRLGQERVEAVEADLFLRVQELRVAQQERDRSARHLAGLNEVALALTRADSVEDLEQVVMSRGMAVLGADGGAIVTAHEEGGWRVTASGALGEHAQARYGHLGADSPLPGVHTARTGERVELATVAEGLARFPSMAEVFQQTGRRGWVFLPLPVEGECLGSLAVSWVQERRLLPEELDLLEGFAAQCAQALGRLQARDAERRTAAAARRMSEALQRSLLTEPVQPDHLEVAVRYLAAVDEAQVGGDWYDVFRTSAGATSLVIGDVAGHDRDAAARMGQVRNLLRGIGYTAGDPPAAVLGQLDRALRDLGIDALATVLLARLEQDEQDEQAGGQGQLVLCWSNAGHPPPVLLRPDGRAELLTTEPDLLVGLDADSPRRDHRVVLPPGSTLLLYTDGLIERRDASIDDGLHWLAGTCQQLADLPLEQFCDRLLAAVGDVDDDVALLAVRARRATS